MIEIADSKTSDTPPIEHDSDFNNTKLQKNNTITKTRLFIILLILIIFIQSVLLLKIQFYKNEKPTTVTEIKTTKTSRFNTLDTTCFDNVPNEWKTFEVGSIGMNFSVPFETYSVGHYVEKIGDKWALEGKIIYAYFNSPENDLTTTKNNLEIRISAVSKNYYIEFGPIFEQVSDGYFYENGSYFASYNVYDEYYREPRLPDEIIEEIESDSGVKILKIKCNRFPEKEYVAQPPFYEMHDGYYGLINLNNETYPGAVVKITTKDEVNNETIEKIFSSIQLH